MIWTPERTAAVLAYRGDPGRHVFVEAGRYSAAPDRWDRVAAARFVADAADLLEVSIEERDVRITAGRERIVGAVTSTFRLVPRWAPAGPFEVELRGGPAHGQAHTVHTLAPLRSMVLDRGRPVLQPPSLEQPPQRVDVLEVEYVPAMWTTESRRWVYTPRA